MEEGVEPDAVELDDVELRVADEDNGDSKEEKAEGWTYSELMDARYAIWNSINDAEGGLRYPIQKTRLLQASFEVACGLLAK